MNTSAKTVSLPFFQSFGCYIIYFGTGPHADDNNFHTAFRAMQDINNTNAQTAELDLQAPGKLASFLFPSGFPYPPSLYGRGFWLTFFMERKTSTRWLPSSERKSSLASSLKMILQCGSLIRFPRPPILPNPFRSRRIR